MTLELRVAIEIGDTDPNAGTYIRLDHRETVIPANEDITDAIALAAATLDRMQTELGQRTRDQLTQVDGLIQQG